jgi:hypothetical protein
MTKDQRQKYAWKQIFCYTIILKTDLNETVKKFFVEYEDYFFFAAAFLAGFFASGFFAAAFFAAAMDFPPPTGKGY